VIRRLRAPLLVVLAVIVLRVAVSLLSEPDPPGGPPSSSYTTGAGGMAAYATLLERHGHAVFQARTLLDRVALAPTDTVLVLDVNVRREEADALGAFVRAGGTLVAGGAEVGRWLEPLVPSAPKPTVVEFSSATVFAPVPETVGVRSVLTSGRYAFAPDGGGGALPILGGPGGDLAEVAMVGRGRVVLVADTYPLTNDGLARADDATFALAIAAPGSRVVFDELPHGYGIASGYGALPIGIIVALLGLGAGIVIFGWSRAWRLGPPRRPDRELPPPRGLVVDAVAATLARTTDHAAGVEPLRREARRLLERRTHGTAGDDALRATALALGATAEEAAALFGHGATEHELLALGRGMARISRRGGNG
jgi:hypothetical protein